MTIQFELFSLHPLEDRVMPARTAPEMFPKADRALVERHRAWLEDGLMEAGTDKLILAYRSWLLKLPEMTLLFDLSVGEDKNRPHRPDMHEVKSNWLNDLGRAGFAPRDVDMVFCSHLHLDHIGWMTRKVKQSWVPTFPSAPHLVTRAELDFWRARHGDYDWMGESYIDSVAPIVDAGLIRIVSEHAELAEGVKVISIPGHSPGMVGIEICRGGQTCVLAADIAHHPLQFREPQLSTIFDHDPDQSEQSRRAFIDRYADSDALIAPIHFPRAAGYLASNGTGVDFKFND